MIGRGKYDDLCTQARTAAGARAALLLILGGDKGHGFACQADAATLQILPDLLEQVAAEIRRSGPLGPPRRG